MQTSSGKYRQFLTQYLGPLWPKALLLGILLFSAIGLELLSPKILAQFIDDAREGAAISILGLLGRTGSGKTTIARLLFRLYDPQSGQILLGGTDIRAAKLAALRDQVERTTITAPVAGTVVGCARR